MSFKVIEPVPRLLWRELSDTDQHALATQSADWIDAVISAHDYEDASRAYEFTDGQVMVLPMVRRRGLIIDLASLPEDWGFGGILSRTLPSPDAVRQVVEDLRGLCPGRLYIRPNPMDAALWEAAIGDMLPSKSMSAHVLDISGGFDRVWGKHFSGKTRNQIRKAEKSGIDVHCDTSGRLSQSFYQLYQLSVQRWVGKQGTTSWLRASRLLSRNTITKFGNIANSLSRNCQTWMAWREGQPIAGIIVVRSAHHAQYVFGAMNKEMAGPVNANDLLHHLAIEDACRAGLRSYHMGTSGDNSALAHFKARFGAKAIGFKTYCRVRSPIVRAQGIVSAVAQRVLRKR